MEGAEHDRCAEAAQLRRELDLARRLQAAIVSAIFSGFLVVDREGRVTELNELGGKILGVGVHEAIGRPLAALVRSRPAVLTALETGTGWSDREFLVETSQGPCRLMTTAVPVKAADGSVLAVIETFRELDEIHEFAAHVMGARARFRLEDIIGTSAALRQAKELARLAARSDSTVLLLGETGTGKEVFAQAIHNASRRARGPYLALNCAALPRDLVESELFGYVEGAFSGAVRGGRAGKFELAGGGTLVLDEVADLSLDLQAKLLRVLQEKTVLRIGGNRVIPVDVRIIAITNRDLRAELNRGNFREDLFYRLNVLAIHLPPLRERREDIPLLAAHFLKKLAERRQSAALDLSPTALTALLAYNWPGNVRELENVLERAASTSPAARIELGDLPAHIVHRPPVAVREPPAAPAAPGPPRTLAEIERAALLEALHRCGGNVTRTARELGIGRTTFYDKLKKHHLGPPQRDCSDFQSVSG